MIRSCGTKGGWETFIPPGYRQAHQGPRSVASREGAVMCPEVGVAKNGLANAYPKLGVGICGMVEVRYSFPRNLAGMIAGIYAGESEPSPYALCTSIGTAVARLSGVTNIVVLRLPVRYLAYAVSGKSRHESWLDSLYIFCRR